MRGPHATVRHQGTLSSPLSLITGGERDLGLAEQRALFVFLRPFFISGVFLRVRAPAF